MAFLCLMNIIDMAKYGTMSICRFVKSSFIGYRKTSPGKMEGGESTLIFSGSGYIEDYRTRLFDYCQKRGLQVLVLLEVNSSNKLCQNLAAEKVLQLVEKQYIDTIVIVGGTSQKPWIETFKGMLKRKVEIEYLSTIDGTATEGSAS